MENRKHTSLKDLAQALGVSIPTVSRALKDSPEISRELCTHFSISIYSLIFSFSFFFLIKSEEKYRKIRYIYH